MSNRNPHELFIMGESLAAKYLTDNGYNIVAKNYRALSGEIDLIATIQDSLVFVEVKTRKDHSMDTVLANIGFRKQQKISRTATNYINQNPQFDNYNTRFDVIIVFYYPSFDSFKIHHLIDAFLPIEEH